MVGAVENAMMLLANRGGADQDAEAGSVSPCMVQYLVSVWQGRTPVEKMGIRNAREARTICEAIDMLIRGELPALGDLLAQRLKAIERSVKTGTGGSKNSWS